MPGPVCIYNTLVLVSGSNQIPGFGINALGAASLTPIEMALMLFRTRTGINALVVPGTSLRLNTDGRVTFNSSVEKRKKDGREALG